MRWHALERNSMVPLHQVPSPATPVSCSVLVTSGGAAAGSALRGRRGGARMMRTPYLARILRYEPRLQSVKFLERAGRILRPRDQAVEGPAHRSRPPRQDGRGEPDAQLDRQAVIFAHGIALSSFAFERAHSGVVAHRECSMIVSCATCRVRGAVRPRAPPQKVCVTRKVQLRPGPSVMFL